MKTYDACTGVSIGFVSEHYSVAENVTEVEVCLNISVPVAITITVTLSVIPDTAECE